MIVGPIPEEARLRIVENTDIIMDDEESLEDSDVEMDCDCGYCDQCYYDDDDSDESEFEESENSEVEFERQCGFVIFGGSKDPRMNSYYSNAFPQDDDDLEDEIDSDVEEDNVQQVQDATQNSKSQDKSDMMKIVQTFAGLLKITLRILNPEGLENFKHILSSYQAKTIDKAAFVTFATDLFRNAPRIQLSFQAFMDILNKYELENRKSGIKIIKKLL